LPDFIGKLPRGLLFTLSAQSPHHAGKRSDYPRELTWLEIKGLVAGPVAYLRSRRVRSTQSALPDLPSAPPAQQAVSIGKTH
jgi:hypothetical protein